MPQSIPEPIFGETHTVDTFFDAAMQLLDHHDYELVNGKIEIVALKPRLYSRIGVRLVASLVTFVDEHDLGTVLGARFPYPLTEDNARVTTASFIGKSRAPHLENSHLFSPDIAIRTIPPNERARATHDWIALFLNAGTQQVWAVYPDDSIIDVWERINDHTLTVATLRRGDTLTCEALLPGFALLLDDVFTDMAG